MTQFSRINFSQEVIFFSDAIWPAGSVLPVHQKNSFETKIVTTFGGVDYFLKIKSSRPRRWLLGNIGYSCLEETFIGKDIGAALIISGYLPTVFMNKNNGSR